MEPTELIFATGNSAKLAQLAFVIAHLKAPIRLVSARERFGEAAHYIETGSRATTIALNGAQEVAVRLGLPVFVEDTTFEVDALQGAPGIRAGEYLKQYGRAGILQALGESDKRRAKMVSAAAWATPYGDAQVWAHSLFGKVARREWVIRGMPDWVGPTSDNPLGGGFNAIFIPWGESRTMAEIPPEEAVSVGYREPNFCALIAFLRTRWRMH